jgi:outer membrane lipoprotein-sorting protein
MQRVGTAVRRQWRWALVGTGVAGLVVLPPIIDARPVPRSSVGVEALTARILASDQQPYHGYAEGRGAMRLPELPGAADLSTLISDTSRMRLWYEGPGRWRTDLLYSGGERDRYRSPEGLWTWDSGTHGITFLAEETQLRLPIPVDLTPPDLVRRMLAAAKPDEITALPSRRVAGHDGDGLRIVPKTAASTIAKIDVWADPATGLPLRAEVTGKGRDHSSLETGFLDLEIGPPDPDLMTFKSPPDGVKNEQETNAVDLVQAIELYSATKLPDTLAGLQRRTPVASGAATYGEGFDVVGVLALPERFVSDTLRALRSSERPWGHSAAVVTTPLVNGMLFADRGTAYIVGGPVTVKELDRVASDIVTWAEKANP